MRLYLYITNAEDYLKGSLDFSLNCSSRDDLEGGGWIKAGSAEVDIDIDDRTLRQHAIGQIESEETELRAVMSGKLNQLESRRRNLLALTHETAA
jgi:hypothetical protein